MRSPLAARLTRRTHPALLTLYGAVALAACLVALTL